jgi:hypothetical protein
MKKSKSKPKSRAKAKTKSKSKSKSKAAAKPAKKAAPARKAASRPKSKAAVEQGPRTAARLRGGGRGMLALAAGVSPIDQITDIAANSAIARFQWPNRGRAPIGYIKGMALVFARVHCKLLAGDSAVTVMAKANTGDKHVDALAWYDGIFSAAGMDNSVAGADTLRHLFVLQIGLGMRESSGRYCEGRDQSADNITADTAEAGLFQTSFDARTASPELPLLFSKYSANPSGFVDTFKAGVSCTARDLENFGSGPGAEFQRLSKACPAFAAEFAAVGLRTVRTHWGPINTKAAEVRPECDAMLQQVQDLLAASPSLCPLVQ